MVSAAIDSPFLENKNGNTLDTASCLTLPAPSWISLACFCISFCSIPHFQNTASWTVFDECITVYVTVCKYFRSLMIKKGKFETWTLPVAIVYISQWPRPVWQWPMSVDIGNSALQQRPFPMETVEERVSWAFLGGTSWFVCSSEKLKQVDSFSQSWQQGAVAVQRKAVHLTSSSQRDRNKGVKSLNFKTPDG